VPRGRTARELLPWIAFTLAAAAAAAAILWYGRHWSFLYDEWGAILYRRAGGLSAFLAPHNGHLEAIPFALYRALFATAGLDAYGWYQAMGAALHLLCAALLFLYARPRVGPWAALAVTVPLLFLADGWEVLLWPYETSVTIPLAALVAILLVRDSARAHRDLLTAALLLVAFMGSGVAVAVAVVAAVDVLLRDRRAGAIASVAAPSALYAAWFLLYRPNVATPESLRRIPGAIPGGDVGYFDTPSHNIDLLPGWIHRSAKQAANAIFSTPPESLVVPLLVLVLLAAVVVRRRTANARLAALLAGLGSYWLLTGLTRAQLIVPAPRYVYPAALLLLLVAVEALRGIRVRAPALAAAAVVLALVVAADVRTLRRVDRISAPVFASQQRQLRAIEACARTLPPSYLPPDPPLGRVAAVTAGPYLAAVRRLGSPVAGGSGQDVHGARCNQQ
jgi:hypothetical protein